VSVVANVAINVDSRNAVSKLRQVQTQSQATGQAVEKLNATAAAASDKFKVAANGVKYFTDATGRARAENGRFLSTAERAAAGIRNQGDAAQQASGKLNGLRNALAGLGVGLALRKSFIDASELESAQSRIKLLGKNFQQLAGIQDVAANAARKFNLSQSESLSALTDLGNRIGPTGASLEDVANVYEGFNTLLALNKVNSQNAASATLQLNQALGSGRLAGEEFNAISEATPQLLDAVAKVLGRNRGELKQLASDGQISSQVLIEALKRIRTEGAADLEASFGGAFGATRRFNAALEDFSATVGTELLPALTPVINATTELLKQFGQLPGPIKTASVVIAGLAGAFVALAPAIGIIQGIIPAVKGLSLAMLAIPGIGWTAAAILGLGLLGKAVFDTNETFRNFVKNIGGVVASDFRTAVDGMADDARTSANDIQKAYEDLSPKLSPIAKFIRELFQGAFKDTSNAAEASASASSSAFSTFFNGLISQGAAAFNGLGALITNWYNNLPAPIRSIFGGNALSMLAGAAAGAGSAASRAAAPNAQATGMYGRYGAPETQVSFAIKPAALNAMGTPVGATVGGGGRAAGGASKAADEAKRLAEELQRSTEQGNDLFRQFSRQAVLLGITSETERKRLQIQYDYQDRAREINELKNAEQKVNLMAVNDEIKRLETLELQTEELKKQLQLFYELAGVPMGEMLPGGAGAFRTDINLDPSDRAQQKIDEYKEKLAELQDPINMAQRGAQAIGDAFSSSFQGIITGTQSVQEALASFFQNVAKSFIDMATEIIAQMVIMYAFKQLLGLFGGGATGIGSVGNFSGAFNGGAASFNAGSFGMDLLPGRAKGGPVSSGQMYMVGERGPELFVPGRSGTIVANDKMGGGSTNVVVNVDAKGSSVAGDEQGANQLGRVISAAVQSELIKQQRPGGLLAR
jgi:tape measure domain-containing protein